MITDNQAKEAIKTIAEYCNQHTADECYNGKCGFYPMCKQLPAFMSPNEWPEHLEAD